MSDRPIDWDIPFEDKVFFLFHCRLRSSEGAVISDWPLALMASEFKKIDLLIAS
jgi:hypothetical protein